MNKFKTSSFRPSDKLTEKYLKKFSKLIQELAIDLADEIERARIGPMLAPFIHRDIMMKFLLDIIVRTWDTLIEAQSRIVSKFKRQGLAK